MTMYFVLFLPVCSNCSLNFLYRIFKSVSTVLFFVFISPFFFLYCPPEGTFCNLQWLKLHSFSLRYFIQEIFIELQIVIKNKKRNGKKRHFCIINRFIHWYFSEPFFWCWSIIFLKVQRSYVGRIMCVHEATFVTSYLEHIFQLFRAFCKFKTCFFNYFSWIWDFTVIIFIFESSSWQVMG